MEFERLIEMRQRYADGIRAEERARCLAWVRWGEREHVGAAAVSTGIESGEWPPEEGA